jgi:hypothetical protein
MEHRHPEEYYAFHDPQDAQPVEDLAVEWGRGGGLEPPLHLTTSAPLAPPWSFFDWAEHAFLVV